MFAILLPAGMRDRIPHQATHHVVRIPRFDDRIRRTRTGHASGGGGSMRGEPTAPAIMPTPTSRTLPHAEPTACPDTDA
jgi:hypothetical protein